MKKKNNLMIKTKTKSVFLPTSNVYLQRPPPPTIISEGRGKGEPEEGAEAGEAGGR